MFKDLISLSKCLFKRKANELSSFSSLLSLIKKHTLKKKIKGMLSFSFYCFHCMKTQHTHTQPRDGTVPMGSSSARTLSGSS